MNSINKLYLNVLNSTIKADYNTLLLENKEELAKCSEILFHERAEIYIRNTNLIDENNRYRRLLSVRVELLLNSVFRALKGYFTRSK